MIKYFTSLNLFPALQYKSLFEGIIYTKSSPLKEEFKRSKSPFEGGLRGML